MAPELDMTYTARAAACHALYVRISLDRSGAEQAAAAGNYSAAEELLREAVALQEQTLGAQHPGLANTLNNLGIVCEMTDNPIDAEHYFRRAYAIATATLAPDHPFIATSRKNFHDFCAARGRRAELSPSPPAVAAWLDAPAPPEAAPRESSPTADQHVTPIPGKRSLPARTWHVERRRLDDRHSHTGPGGMGPRRPRHLRDQRLCRPNRSRHSNRPQRPLSPPRARSTRSAPDQRRPYDRPRCLRS